jgi:hypothetical protein
MTKLLTLTLSVCLFSWSCVPSRVGVDRERSERLATERGKLIDLTDPMSITRSQIGISRILLDFISDSVRDRDVEALNAILPQYRAAIRGARNAMVSSDIDPIRRPSGYRELEIALGEHIPRLVALTESLPVDERPVLAATLEEATSIRAEMTKLLSPQARLY